MKAKIIDFVLKKPWMSIGLCLAFVFAMVPGATLIKQDFGSKIWYSKNDPLIKSLEHFERTFGSDEFVGIVLHSDNGFLNAKALEQIRTITDKSWLIKDVIRVDSLANHMVSQAQGDDLLIEKMIPDSEISKETVDRVRSNLEKDKVLKGYLVDDDFKMAVLIARLRPVFDDEQLAFDQIVENTQQIIDTTDLSAFDRAEVIGTIKVTDSYRIVSNSDLAMVLPVMLLLVIIFLFYNFRSLEAVLLPFSILFLSTAATFGLEGYLGYSFNNLTSAIPGILLAITIADTVHLLATFYKAYYQVNDFDKAIRIALEKNIGPTFMTSVSTSIGFFTLGTSDIVPIRDLGVLSGFGTMVAWLLTIFFLPCVFKLIPNHILEKTKIKTKKPFITKERSAVAVSWLNKLKWPIVIGFISFTVLSGYLSTKNRINSDPLEYFRDSVPVKQTYDFMRDQLGAAGGPEIVIHSGEVDGVKDPAFLKKVEEFDRWITQNVPTVKSSISILSIIKDLNQNFNGGDERFYVLPETRDLIAQFLFLYSMNLPQGLGLNNRVSNDFENLRLSVTWNIPDSHRAVKQIDRINDKAKKLGLHAYVSGQMPLYHRLNGYVVNTFFDSMGLAIILVTLFMIIIFKSLKLGMISMFPNVIPLTIGGALMYFSGSDVDISAAIDYSVCLGVVVDDTIHFLFDYNRQRKLGLNPFDAIVEVITNTGPALILTTVILAIGFGLFIFSNFMPNVNFGIYCALIFLVALIVDLIFLPALLLLPYKEKTA